MRICANKVVAGGRFSTLVLNIRPQDTRQFTSAQRFDQLEGLAVAIPWGFESPPSAPLDSALRASLVAGPAQGRVEWCPERRSRESKGIPTSPNPD